MISTSALSYFNLLSQVIAQQVPVTRQIPKQVTSTIQENGKERQVTNTVMENVHEMTTQHVTIQRPVQQAIKRVVQVPQTVNVVHEHEEIIQHERPRMVARVVHETATDGGPSISRVVHEHASGGVIHHGHKGVRQVGHHVVQGAGSQEYP